MSFAAIAWRRATAEGCPACERPASPGSPECPACQAIFDELIFDERLDRVTSLYAQVEQWQHAGLLTSASVARLRRAIAVAEASLRAPVAETDEAPVEAAPAPPPTPVQVKVTRPPFRWRQLGESLLAERTLNTLLGLGAFLILASALVISIFNPTRLPLVPHMAVLVGTTVLFYAAGWFCHARMRLTRAGEALLGIAAAFVPLDVWSLGGPDGLGWSAATIWTVASAVALPVYAVSYALLPGRIFAWLFALAPGSLLLALLTLLDVPLEWRLCAVMPLALGYVALSTRVSGSLRGALFGVAHAATPVILLVLLAAKLADVVTVYFDVSEYAVGGAWWLGVGLYALSARLRLHRVFSALTACLLPVAYLLTLAKTPWDGAWYGVCLVALAAAYAAYAARARRDRVVGLVAVVLTVVGAVWPLVDGLTWALIAALLADGLLYAAVALALRSTRVAFIPTALLSTTVLLVLQLAGWSGWTPGWPLPWLVLTMVLGVGAEALMRASGEQRRPLADVLLGRGTWRAIFAPALFDLAQLAGLVTVVLALARSTSGDVALNASFVAIIAIGAAVVAWTRASSVFLYPATVLLPVALVMALSSTWRGDALSLSIGVALALLAAAYALIGQWLERMAGARYRWPLWIAGFTLSAIGPSVGLLQDAVDAALVAAACGALFWVVVAVVRRPAWAYPALLWTLASYEIGLRGVFDLTRGQALTGLVLPTVLAITLAELFAARHSSVDRVRGPFALAALARAPWAVPLLVSAALGFVLSLAGALDYPRSGSAVMAVYAVVLAVLATRHGPLLGERWAAVALLGLAGLLGLSAADVRVAQQPPFAVGLGLVLAGLGVLAECSRHPNILAWRTPLLWAAIGSAGLGELIALVGAFTRNLGTAALTTALGGLVLLTLAYGRRSRLLAYGGVGALLGAGLLELADGRISQPQAYVLPVGAYLAVLAWLEWRRGDPARLKVAFEVAALVVVFGTALLQSLGYAGDGVDRLQYAVEMIVLGLVLLGLGALVHWWRSLFTGAGAVVAAVLILLVEPLKSVDTWYLIGSIGMLLIAGVVFLERRRQQIPIWLDGWRERLESWA